MKNYAELIRLKTFEERFDYLKLNGHIGERTFGGHRTLNQILYESSDWKSVRRRIIVRDNGYDLGLEGYPIRGKILVHHIEPITIDDVLKRRPCVFDEDNLVCTSHNTHNAIHYGFENSDIGKRYELVDRFPNDQCPWRR